MSEELKELKELSIWFYDKETGLYYDNEYCIGFGYTFSEIEAISDCIIN